ncbi:MAG: prepilin-type N-terminal cleavage/methylation domain-containing protein [Fimbriimonadaceae bacterium]|nr:prepilin-type N-terminal cleavage/methylation domain-containing protein [Fimbriimonadaceae bacterium]
MSKRGFTLIELLVVIAIISILAAILFPVFAQAKNAAKGIVCISNMKQLSAASILYVSDYDGMWYPLARYEPLAGFAPQVFWIGYDDNNGPNVNGYWGRVDEPAQNPIRPGLIDIYLKNDDIKKCPNKPGKTQTALAANGFSPLHNSAYYVTNPAAQGQEYGPGAKTQAIVGGTFDFTAVQESEIEESSATLAAWEHDAFVPLCNFLQPHDWVEGPPPSQALKDHFNLLHTSGTNTFWCDGHAKRIGYGALKRRWFSVRKDIYP